MPSKTSDNLEEAQLRRLRRLAIVFSYPLRLKIVTELNMREMSSTQFFEEFGGSSVPRVDRHFRRLAEHGWLTLVRSKSGGSRRGARENFYRAVEPAVFDDDSWMLLPYSVRVAFSWRTFEQLSERVIEATEAGTFDSRSDRHLSWTSLVLDQDGWDSVMSAMDAVFNSLTEVQEDARARIADSGDRPTLITVALAGFESPFHRQGKGVEQSRPILVPPVLSTASTLPWTRRLASIFADPLSLNILSTLNTREMSPTMFHFEFGGAPKSAIFHRFRKLRELGWLTIVEEKTGGERRGGVERLYRATDSSMFDNHSWSEIPASLKAGLSWRTFEQLTEQVKEAMRAGTFDSRSDRYLTWSLLQLDALGWEQIVGAVDGLLDFILQEREAARKRLGRSGEKVLTTTALAAFESPRDASNNLEI